MSMILILGWRFFLFGLIGGAEASAVAATRKKWVIASSRVKPSGNSFPKPNEQWWNLKAFDNDDVDVESADYYRGIGYSTVRSTAKRLPWRRLSGLGFASSGLATMPGKLLVFTGPVAMYVANTIYKLHASEPVRRSLYFWRKAGPIVAHYKFTRWWLTISKADRQKRDIVFETLHNQYALPSLDLVLHLRGLYVKMGQILSSRPDFMPPQYVKCFSELQDSIPPWDTNEVRIMAVEALQKNCPAFVDYEDLILDPVALGSASIGQVHRAVLRQKNSSMHKPPKEVAVKIMHRGAEAKFQHDFQVFRWLCRIAIPSWRGVLDALEKQVMTEFNYLNEAAALKEVRNNMLRSPYRNRVCVPEPMDELCCEHVLVMEMLHGKKLIDSIRERLKAAIGGSEEKATEFLAKRRHEVMTGDDAGSEDILRKSVNAFGKLKLLFLFEKCRRVIDLLVDVHGYQIFRTGTWNGDPHFGNCLQLDDGRLGLIDYGQTRRIENEQRVAFARVVVALNKSGKLEGVISHHASPFNATAVASAMRDAGFATRDNADDEMMTQYARLLFDSDEESERQGFTIPQEYFKSLMDVNPLVVIPDSAIFVGRTSLMFRGMGSAIGSGQIRTATRWHKHAQKAVQEAAK